jgi:hypothetical protein
MYAWVPRFGLFTLLLLLPAMLFLINSFYFSSGMCATIVLIAWIGMGVIVIEELMRRREG